MPISHPFTAIAVAVMYFRPRKRRAAVGKRSVVALAVLVGTTLLVFSSSAQAAKPHRASLAGTWSGTYGGAFSGTFTLHWKQVGTRLSGTITLSYPRGRYGINGSVHGTAITFGAVGAGATYSGSVSGTSMSGGYKSPQGGGRWSAHKRA